MKNFLQLLMSSVLGQVFFFFGLLHLARTITPESFGLWNLAQAWMLYLFRFGELGLEVVGIRAIAQGKNVRAVVWSVVFVRLLILFLLVICVVMMASANLFPEGSTELIVILSLTLLPLALLLEWVFEAHQYVGSISVIRIVRGFLFLGFVFFFVTREDHLDDAAYYYVASVAIANLLIGWVAIKHFKLLPAQLDSTLANQLFRDGLPIGIATILSNYSFFAGTVFIGYMVGGSKLGFYTAAHRLIVFFWAYGIATAHRVLLPQFSKLFHGSETQLYDFMFRVVKLTCLFSLPVCIVGLSAGDELIGLLYGARYAESGLIFKIFTGVFFVSIVRSILEIGLLAAGRQNIFLKGMIGVALATTLLTLGGVFYLDIVGAAWAMLVVEVGYAVYLFKIFGRFGIRSLIGSILGPTVTAAAIVVAFAVFSVSSIWVIVPFGIGLYGIILYTTRQITSSDIRQVLNLLRFR